MKTLTEVRANIANILYHEGDSEFNGFKTYGAKELSPLTISIENKNTNDVREDVALGVYIDASSGNIVVHDVSLYDGEQISLASWNDILDGIMCD